MDFYELQNIIKTLRDEQGLTKEQIRIEISRRLEAETDDEYEDCDEVECGYDRPIAGVPLPPIDVMIDSCL